MSQFWSWWRPINWLIWHTRNCLLSRWQWWSSDPASLGQRVPALVPNRSDNLDAIRNRLCDFSEQRESILADLAPCLHILGNKVNPLIEATSTTNKTFTRDSCSAG